MALIGKDISKAIEILQSGRLVAIPTETVYGLAGNALDPEAIARIYETKNRPSFDPLIVHISGINELAKYVDEIPDKAGLLAERFWPGPLTLLLPKAEIIPDMVTSGMSTVAIRVPDNKLTLGLLEKLPFPLVAPSANPFGYISPTTASHVNDQLGERIDYILDGGACHVGLESTIIGFPEGRPTIYRLGGLTIDNIREVIGEVDIRPHSSSNPRAPGMLKSHYAPRLPFRLFPENSMQRQKLPKGAAALVFQNPPAGINALHLRILAPDGDLHTAAKNLFRFMRELDNMDADVICAEEVPDTGIGKAINDRLRRAAAGE